jgi:hypothetical protein
LKRRSTGAVDMLAVRIAYQHTEAVIPTSSDVQMW